MTGAQDVEQIKGFTEKTAAEGQRRMSSPKVSQNVLQPCNSSRTFWADSK